MRKVAPWYALAMLVALLDQLTKYWISAAFQFAEARPVTGFFNLVLAYNKGAAFSFLASESGWQRSFFITIALVAVVVIGFLLARHSGERLFSFALGLILGGAMGNVIDRMVFGYVIDFLDFHVAGWHWPAFNLADSAISVGAVLLVFDSFRPQRKSAGDPR